MLIQWKGAHAVTQLSLNDLENRYLLVTKLRSESSAIVSRRNLEAFNTFIAKTRAGGLANEQATALVYDFVYVSIVEVLAAKFIKQFYVITHPFTEIHAIFWGIEAYLRRIKTSPRAVHAGSTPVASKRTNSDGSGVVPQQLIPPGALGHFFPLVTPMGGEAALSGRKRKRLLSPRRVRIN